MKKLVVVLLMLLTFISCKDEITVITSKQPGKIVGTILPKEAIATVQLLQGEAISSTSTTNGIFQFEDVLPGISVEISPSYSSSMIISPIFGWMADTTINITVSKLLEEINGATLESDTTISFTTPKLEIVETFPLNNQYYIDTTSVISVEANYALDEQTIKNAISISPNVDFQISTYTRYGRTEFRLYPTHLNPNTKYTVTIDQSLTDFYGVPLREDYIFSFTTKE
ncbi:MAG: Ig-like domain-containing protein [Melioribacteraceae bacterium]|jgi:hypothetical protein|nr:Ig-like domain-containing protein [Melioribacteraceae bacterium]